MDTPLSIYVLVDALGWEVVRNRRFLDDILPDRRWLTTILGYSSGAIPPLLSGRRPALRVLHVSRSHRRADPRAGAAARGRHRRARALPLSLGPRRRAPLAHPRRRAREAHGRLV